MTFEEKKRLIPKIKIGSYIFDEYDTYKVIDIYKHGIKCRRDWDNFAGHFYEHVFISYEELYNSNNWTTIIIA